MTFHCKYKIAAGEDAAFFIKTELGSGFLGVVRVVYHAKMFPYIFLASMDIEAQKIRVDGVGLLAFVEFERILVSVGNLVAGQGIGNNHL